MKLCKDCKYTDATITWCNRPIPPVGKPKLLFCREERMVDHACGTEGRYYEPSLMYRIFGRSWKPFTLILIIALVLGGCLTQDANSTSRNPDYYIDHIIDNGHSYLVVVTSVNYGYHNANIIHAEHCQCKGGR